MGCESEGREQRERHEHVHKLTHTQTDSERQTEREERAIEMSSCKGKAMKETDQRGKTFGSA